MFSRVCRSSRPFKSPLTNRFYSQQNGKFRQLIRAPIFKSIFLTLVLGSATIDLMKSRKELEALESTYHNKCMILEDLAKKLENNEKVDISKELQLANSLTKMKYNTVTDIEFDQSLELFVNELVSDKTPAVENAAGSNVQTKSQTKSSEVAKKLMYSNEAKESGNSDSSSDSNSDSNSDAAKVPSFASKLNTSKFL